MDMLTDAYEKGDTSEIHAILNTSPWTSHKDALPCMRKVQAVVHPDKHDLPGFKILENLGIESSTLNSMLDQIKSEKGWEELCRHSQSITRPWYTLKHPREPECYFPLEAPPSEPQETQTKVQLQGTVPQDLGIGGC